MKKCECLFCFILGVQLTKYLHQRLERYAFQESVSVHEKQPGVLEHASEYLERCLKLETKELNHER